VGIEKNPFAALCRVRHAGLQPSLLLGFRGQAGVDDLRIDQEEPAVSMVEGLKVGAEILPP
jgi:hypothetical protein